MEDGRLKDAMHEVILNHFDAFTKKHWDKIKNDLQLNDTQSETLFKELRRLNPKPGSSFNDTIGKSDEQITPDFTIDINEEGKVVFTINQGNIPQLVVSEDYKEELQNYEKKQGKQLTHSDKEAMAYYRDKVEKANWFIDAVKKRRHTMEVTMKAIIAWQHKYFLEGDESDLRPMILEDIAKKTGLDISTISRVSNQKYAETRWGIFPLKYFFNSGFTAQNGEELSSMKIKTALKNIIDKEDKKHPRSDQQLVDDMKKIGFPIARRTIAKYREQIGYPIARLRKE